MWFKRRKRSGPLRKDYFVKQGTVPKIKSDISCSEQINIFPITCPAAVFLHLYIICGQYIYPENKFIVYFSKPQNKMFCSLVAQLVSLACLIGIARCLESFQCVTELVLLHNRCHMVPLNDLFFWGGGYLSPVCTVELNKVWRTCHRCPILQYTSHSGFLWDLCLIPHLMLVRHLISAVFKTTTLGFTNRCQTQIVLIVNLFFPLLLICFQCAKMTHTHLLIISMESLSD